MGAVKIFNLLKETVQAIEQHVGDQTSVEAIIRQFVGSFNKLKEATHAND